MGIQGEPKNVHEIVQSLVNMYQGILKSQTDNIEKFLTLRKPIFSKPIFRICPENVQKLGHPKITRMDKIGELQGLKQEREYMWVYGSLIGHVTAPFLSSLAYRRGVKIMQAGGKKCR